ncbi:MAG TPA: hypothetical protein VKC61_13580 [Pyrinomonadaceae bacterium]|nr:hypothetical protein [Pyrinomonadaceae bacterium]
MNTLDRNLTVFEAHCLINQHKFEAYNFSDFEYGERIIRTADGEDFALITIEDSVVDEVGAIIAEIYESDAPAREQIQRFNSVFGLACDPINEKALDPLVRVICPFCKTKEVSYRAAKPIRYKSFSIPVITHQKWAMMSHGQKRSVIEKGLRLKGLL